MVAGILNPINHHCQEMREDEGSPAGYVSLLASSPSARYPPVNDASAAVSAGMVGTPLVSDSGSERERVRKGINPFSIFKNC